MKPLIVLLLILYFIIVLWMMYKKPSPKGCLYIIFAIALMVATCNRWSGRSVSTSDSELPKCPPRYGKEFNEERKTWNAILIPENYEMGRVTCYSINWHNPLNEDAEKNNLAHHSNKLIFYDKEVPSFESDDFYSGKMYKDTVGDRIIREKLSITILYDSTDFTDHPMRLMYTGLGQDPEHPNWDCKLETSVETIEELKRRKHYPLTIPTADSILRSWGLEGLGVYRSDREIEFPIKNE